MIMMNFTQYHTIRTPEKLSSEIIRRGISQNIEEFLNHIRYLSIVCNNEYKVCIFIRDSIYDKYDETKYTIEAFVTEEDHS